MNNKQKQTLNTRKTETNQEQENQKMTKCTNQRAREENNTFLHHPRGGHLGFINGQI